MKAWILGFGLMASAVSFADTVKVSDLIVTSKFGCEHSRVGCPVLEVPTFIDSYISEFIFDKLPAVTHQPGELPTFKIINGLAALKADGSYTILKCTKNTMSRALNNAKCVLTNAADAGNYQVVESPDQILDLLVANYIKQPMN